MSKVASITISTKSRQKSPSCDSSPVSPGISKADAEDGIQYRDGRAEKPAGITSSDSEEDKGMRRRRSSGSSPERRLSSQRRYDTYDQERGLVHAGRSGKMSSRQRTLEQELNTTDPSFVASSDDALASSEDGVDDAFIPRKSSETYYMVKCKDETEESGSGSVYEKKNIEPPRSKSQPAGNRVQSATGRLMDNYVKDQSFDNLSEGENFEKPKTSVSILKAAYAQKAVENKPVGRYKVDEELEQIRFTMQNRGMMERDDEPDAERNHVEPEVMCRKPLSSIKNKFFAAVSGKKIESGSDSEDDNEKKNNKEEIVASSQPVVDIRNRWHEKGKWEDRNKELDEEVRLPLQSVFELKKRWLGERPWSCDEVVKDDVICPELKVVDMTKHWQQNRTFTIDKDEKEDLIALDQSVLDMKKNWPMIHSFSEENKENIELVVPPMNVTEMKEKWQQGVPWTETHIDEEKPHLDIDAFEDINVSHVGSARSTFKQMENRREVTSTVNKPRVNKIADPNAIMQERRHITYGDESQVDGVIRHEGQDELATLDVDVNQIKAAKSTFQVIEGSKQEETKQVRRPSMKLIKQEDVSKTMDQHRRKVSAEDFDDYTEHIKPNGTAPHLVNGSSEQ